VRKTCQGMQGKSKAKFELLGRKEAGAQLPLRLVELWEDLRLWLEQLTGEAEAAHFAGDSRIWKMK
jgi:hypothetical protein